MRRRLPTHAGIAHVPGTGIARRAVCRRIVIGVVTMLVCGGGAAAHGASDELDPYGGVRVPGARGTGFFRIEKIGSRWIFLTPDGDPFWLLGVYAVDWADGGSVAWETYKAKFNSDQFAFATHALRRIRSWGFNAVAPYSSAYTVPVPTFNRREGNAERMPFLRLMNVSWYGAINKMKLAPDPFKTLLVGAVDREVYKGWPGHTPDVFDPNFEIFARGIAADLKTETRPATFTEKTQTGGLPNASLLNTPWLLGTTVDDVDYVFGMGPGPEVPGVSGVVHPHIGWIVAVTRPTQSENPDVGSAFGSKQTVVYRDPTVHAKVAWRDFLKKKHGTIEALNRAWGATYTTFDSDGGWPLGKGVMDESGRSPWIGRDPERLTGVPAAVAADLDAFLEIFADRYFGVVSRAARASTPNHLVLCPAALNGHKGLTRRPILRAAGRHCDAIEVNQHQDKPELMAITYEEARKPLFSWMGIKANADSFMRQFPATTGSFDRPSQRERGALYERQVTTMLSFKTSDGTSPMVGLTWWEYMDKWGERANWGLVSPRHNAYDGKQAVRAPGKDAWGVATGGEDADYGDFLSAVTRTNRSVVDRLRAEFSRASGMSAR